MQMQLKPQDACLNNTTQISRNIANTLNFEWFYYEGKNL